MADIGSSFSGWQGECSGSGDCVVTIDLVNIITATFTSYTFTLQYAAGPNGSLTGVTSQTVNYGEDGSPVTGVPNTGYHFVDWSDGSTANPRTDTNVMDDVDVTANFAIDTFTLNYTAGPNGSLTGVISQTVNYGEDGTPVLAVPNTDYHFVDWSDGSTANPRTDTNVMSDVDVTANFALDIPDQYSLTIIIDGMGIVSVDPDKSLYDDGDVITLTATSDPRWSFIGWSGDLVSMVNPVTIVMDEDKIITATFVPQQYYIYLPLLSKPLITP
jgi:hypothetical protein